jgi:hypothetical protein
MYYKGFIGPAISWWKLPFILREFGAVKNMTHKE